MKLMSILSKLSIFALLLFQVNIFSQTFSSRKATLNEKVQIMYLRGYFNFLYASKNNTKLVLNKDSTFTINQNFCKKGSITEAGKWKLINNELTLKLKKPKTLKFRKFNDKVYYRIINITRVADNKKMKSLTLLSL